MANQISDGGDYGIDGSREILCTVVAADSRQVVRPEITCGRLRSQASGSSRDLPTTTEIDLTHGPANHVADDKLTRSTK
ncbi:uncharacterized protein A4U43_C04F16940 [Asparagus officinalis]|uniref:Uncharacterized protein n=1 Tax=Asparagus officinalis TaxID=4686 RepID=A0A5P1F1G3_ASPOF|nr:uncharacterized protein A4U43_C04F16940 [Asparagus officinalis]